MHILAYRSGKGPHFDSNPALEIWDPQKRLQEERRRKKENKKERKKKKKNKKKRRRRIINI